MRRGAALFGETYTHNVLAQFAEWDEEFAELFQHFAYGGLYDRQVIPQKWRQLLVVAACVCLNAPSLLEVHAKAALRMGATKEEVQEAIIQMAAYAGFPYTSIALRHFHDSTKDWTPDQEVYPVAPRE